MNKSVQFPNHIMSESLKRTIPFLLDCPFFCLTIKIKCFVSSVLKISGDQWKIQLVFIHMEFYMSVTCRFKRTKNLYELISKKNGISALHVDRDVSRRAKPSFHL